MSETRTNLGGDGARIAPERFLDPRVLARIDNLELVARVVVDGFISGLHKAVFRGSSPDFAEYRAYTPGDDIRRVDWRVFARTDRLYVKTYEAETNADVMFMLDVSASMDFTSAHISKLDYARFVLATLAHLAARQRDRVGFMTIVNDVVDHLPASAKHRHSVLHALARSRAGGAGDLRAALAKAANLLGRRGIVVVVSDFYDEPARVLDALDELRARGHEVIAFHVLDREERTLELGRAEVLEDLESGQRMPVGPAGSARYRELMDAHIAALATGSVERAIDYTCLVTDQPLDEMLWHYLSQRDRLARVR